ncbi:glycosyltransferase family 2 protein [Candidatus Micrarchaeota archaeon]|nr:glycosyltransferase family 2 protein [Candidatus Micrarchaeota archaeon]
MPAYNVESTIVTLLLRLNAVVIELKKQNVSMVSLIVVDDGSTDKTVSLVSSTKASLNFDLVYVRKTKNEGPIRAIRDGLGRSVEITSSKRLDPLKTIILRMDSDLEHQPEDIPTAIKPLIQNKSDAVVGIMPIDLRNGIGFYLFNQIIGRIESHKYLGLEIPQFCPGFLALRFDVLSEIVPRLSSRADKFYSIYQKDMLGWDFIILCLLRNSRRRLTLFRLLPIESQFIKKQRWDKILNYYSYHKLTCEFLDKELLS